jgi:transcriptional regulator with XRE-family HTH domain
MTAQTNNVEIISEEFKDIIHTNILQARSSTKLTQQQVAAEVGMSATGYKNIERGRSVPSAYTLFKLAVLFNVNVSVLFPSQRQQLAKVQSRKYMDKQ